MHFYFALSKKRETITNKPKKKTIHHNFSCWFTTKATYIKIAKNTENVNEWSWPQVQAFWRSLTKEHNCHNQRTNDRVEQCGKNSWYSSLCVYVSSGFSVPQLFPLLHLLAEWLKVFRQSANIQCFTSGQFFWGHPVKACFFPSSTYPCRLKERNAIQYKTSIAFFTRELWNSDLKLLIIVTTTRMTHQSNNFWGTNNIARRLISFYWFLRHFWTKRDIIH